MYKPKFYTAKYLGGIPIYQEKKDGSITINEETLEFTSLNKKLNITIPIQSILNVQTETRTNKANTAASLIGFGAFGLLMRDHNKDDVLTVTFKDLVGDVHNAEFAFPKDLDYVGAAVEQLYEFRLKQKTVENEKRRSEG